MSLTTNQWRHPEAVAAWATTMGPTQWRDDLMIDEWTKRRTPAGVATRDDLVPNSLWDHRANRLYDLARVADAGSFLMLTHRVPVGKQEQVFGVTLHRPFGDPNFRQRDRAVLALFNDELRRLHLQSRLAFRRSLMDLLTTRQQAVLQRIIAGDSSKQIAAHLGISPHTANDHIKAIYRRLNVNGLSELLSFLVRVGPAGL